jgi:choline dehydrogenase
MSPCQDHIFVGPAYETNTSQFDTFTRLADDIPYTADQFLNFSTAQLGPFTNNVADLLAFVRPNDLQLDLLGASVIKTYPRDWPTNEFFSAPGYVGDFASLLIDNFRLGRAGVAGVGAREFATILAAIVAPQSKGRVTLKSADTNDLPNVDMGWLTDPVDQRLAVYGFKQTRKFFAANSMKPARANDQEFYPGLDVSDDAAILNHV